MTNTKIAKSLGRPVKIGKIETRCTTESALSGVIAARLRSFCRVTRVQQKKTLQPRCQRAVVHVAPVPPSPAERAKNGLPRTAARTAISELIGRTAPAR